MLDGKVAVVTGGGQGIGRGIALGLAAKGASVVIADVDSGSAEAVASELRATHHNALAIRADVSVSSDVSRLMSTVLERFGRIDILVNNAGLSLGGSAIDMTEELWDRIIDVNLKGEFMCSREAAKAMIKQGGGKIINFASVAGHGGIPEMSAYCASKGAVIALTRALAVEWAKYGITVNSVSPGRTQTPTVEARRKAMSAEAFEKRNRRVPLGRLGQVQDVVHLVVFLAGNESNYITGQDIVIDGGLFAMHPGYVQE